MECVTVKQNCVKFHTEMGMIVEVEDCIELTDHLTGEIYPASKASPEQAVIIPKKWVGTKTDTLALRSEGCYRRQRSRARVGAA